MEIDGRQGSTGHHGLLSGSSKGSSPTNSNGSTGSSFSKIDGIRKCNVSFTDTEEIEYFDDVDYEPCAAVEDGIDGHYKANYTDTNLHKTFGKMSIAKSAADIRKVMSTMKNKATSPSSSRELVPFVPPRKLSPMKAGLPTRGTPLNVAKGQQLTVMTDGGDGKPEAKKCNFNAKVHEITYVVSLLNRSKKGALVDRGANGGVAENDVRVICKSDWAVNITGIDNHEMKNISIGMVGGVVKSQHGEVIAIMHQYAIAGRGRTIHSSAQLEHYKNDVNDKSVKVKGGLQCSMTIDGYLHPIDIINGLPHSPIRPYTDDEWDKLPHVVWTSDMEWDPSIIDSVISNNNRWHLLLLKGEGNYIDNQFNLYGEYIRGEPGWRNNKLISKWKR